MNYKRFIKKLNEDVSDFPNKEHSLSNKPSLGPVIREILAAYCLSLQGKQFANVISAYHHMRDFLMRFGYSLHMYEDYNEVLDGVYDVYFWIEKAQEQVFMKVINDTTGIVVDVKLVDGRREIVWPVQIYG